MKRAGALMILATLTQIHALAQSSEYGIDVPVTLSGGLMDTGRLQLRNPSASPWAPGFQAMLYPTLRLGTHWFGYAAVQTRWNPYVYYDAFSPQHQMETNVIQAYGGYTWSGHGVSLVLKAGQLASAFGSFPLHYDDAQNPLLDQPLPYIATLTLRDDQIPCGTADLIAQHYGSISNHCGGEVGRASGLTPITLYGLPGAEADMSAGPVDARVQFTSESPAYAEGFEIDRQYLQWTAGGGYTIRHGFRIGVSGFRGPYLDEAVSAFLPPGTTLRDFPASALGVDAQWARGRWSVSGEFQRFRFDSPNFVVSPGINTGYVEVKAILTPRLFAATRIASLNPGRAVDKSGVAVNGFAPFEVSSEFAGGWWINRHQLLKVSYEWLKSEGSTGTRTNVLGFQFVTTFHPLALAFH